MLLDGGFGVQDLGEVELDPDMNVGRGCRIASDIFEEKFRFRKVEALRVDELQIRVQKLLALAHFEEAVDDEDEFREIGGKKSAKDIFGPWPRIFLPRRLLWNIVSGIRLIRIVKCRY